MVIDEGRWLLPAGIEEILPPRAQVLEGLRRELLDLYRSWGYELAIPPFVDYLESLLTGTGRDLDIQTFKLIDQTDGRLLGVRADMTPQVARMDAHHLRREGPTRLCYLGTVLHTRADGFAGTRSPYQIGAEIYGHAGIESDTEIVRLVLATLAVAGIEGPWLDLGHVGIFRGLARQAGLDEKGEYALFDALQRKSIPEIESLMGELRVSGAPAEMLLALAELNGDDAIDHAVRVLGRADTSVLEAVDYLRRLADELHRFLPDCPVHYDLAELRGYRYKTGAVFAAFVPGWGQEIARGGRYDDIGRVFGRARPAVGFSADLKGLMRLGWGLEERFRETPAIHTPWSADPDLAAAVDGLRRAGRRVVVDLPGAVGDARELGCGERLVRGPAGWQVETIEEV
jgi:ATP phosphoribosyltransferase regulatory subunit